MTNSNQSIFSVKFKKISAEFEVSSSSVRCVTGDTIHFDISVENLRAYVQTKSNNILFNFYQNNELYQATITSKHCISILNFLKESLSCDNS
ncbi:MAG: hypothetical protein HRU07_09850 [Nitrosopumilus sp.]|nr:hypothetical protein [Nitrosopumilus sp.]NRA06430.1 hypothetical protein [Nitrosopumilus sp.]